MRIEIPERFKRYFEAADIPGGGKEETTDTHLVLTRDKLIELYMRKEEFFNAVTALSPVAKLIISDLNRLEKKGIINNDGVTKGCKSCKKKALMHALLRILKATQGVMVHLKREAKLRDLGDQVRKFLNTGKIMVIYLGRPNGTKERIEF